MVAKPRADAEIRRFMRGMTGSRIGYRNQRIAIEQGRPIHGSFTNARPGLFSASAMVSGTTTGEEFYADDRIDVSRYWQSQDRMLDGGRAEVGPIAVDRGARKP